MTEIIAEIGINHNGSLELAKKLIKEAKASGADTVKFQAYITDNLASKETPKADYQLNAGNIKETHYEMLKKFEISESEQIELRDFCNKIGINYLCTPYDIESFKMLQRMDVNRFKTASADIVDFFLHDAISKTNKDVLISTGMSDFKDIREVLKIYKGSKAKISLLHCVSNYPCSDESLNLNVLQNMKKTFGLNVGFSDHSKSDIPSIISLALGAEIIEKHFTLDKRLEGPDHKASYNPFEFNEFVKKIRKTSVMLGKQNKRLQEEERSMMLTSRKSLHAKKNIFKGESITMESLCAKRPGNGISPIEAKKIVGKFPKKDILKNEKILLNKLK